MIIRASSLGSCLLGQVAAALGHAPIPHDAATELRFAEGNLHEDDVVARLTADGYTITRQQEEVTLGTVVGHLDGIITAYPTVPAGDRVLEIKSMSKDAYKAFDSKGWYGDWPDGSLVDRYRWQLSVYMLATGLEALLVTKDRNSGQIAQHGIETPYYSLSQITDRVALIEDHVQRRQLPTVCPHDWFCDYRFLCPRDNSEGEAGTAPPDEFTVTDPAILALVAQYGQLQEQQAALMVPVAAQLKVLDKQLDEVKAELKERLPGLVETGQAYTAGGYRVTWVEAPTKASVRRYASVKKIEKETP